MRVERPRPGEEQQAPVCERTPRYAAGNSDV
jgi:hypothetical protein